MRISSNQAAQALPESGRTSSQNAANQASQAENSTLAEDLAQLSGAHMQVQALATQVLQLPEVRQEKVNALRQVVQAGTYQPGSDQIADAVFHSMLAVPAA
jgi:negative regulator of flagellin synthesis FlgM